MPMRQSPDENKTSSKKTKKRPAKNRQSMLPKQIRQRGKKNIGFSRFIFKQAYFLFSSERLYNDHTLCDRIERTGKGTLDLRPQTNPHWKKSK